MTAKQPLSVIWAGSGALLVKLLSEWERLPERVAVHFGMAMQRGPRHARFSRGGAEPNGWSSKNGLAAVVLIAVLGQAALATWVLLRVGSAAGLIGR